MDRGTTQVERRGLLDRRRRPTSLWSILGPGGRRRAFRRQGEAENRYVDHLSPRVVTLAFLILFLSILDAWFTLVHLGRGAIEANPVMWMVLVHGGTTLFLAVKTWITGLGVAFLAAHQNFRISTVGLNSIAILYACLFAYHVALFLSIP